MKKGKFGVDLCFYPIAAFACVILKQPLLCTLLLAAVLFLERDEWAGRQTVQAWITALLTVFFTDVVRGGVSLLFSSFYSPFLSNFFPKVFSILAVLVYGAAAAFSILGIVRVIKGQEANLPLLSDLAYRVYGQQKPKPFPGQYPPPYTPQYPAQPPMPPQQPKGTSPFSGGPQTGGPQNGPDRP